VPKHASGSPRWLPIVAVAVLSIVFVGLVQAFLILFNDECGPLMSLTKAQACMRQNLGNPDEWLNVRLAILVALAGAGNVLAVWETRALRLPYRPLIGWLIVFSALAAFAIAGIYTNGFFGPDR